MVVDYARPPSFDAVDRDARARNAAGHRPLDVLIVTSEAPPIVSGIATCVDRLASGLTGRGHRVQVLSSVQVPRITVGEWRLSSFVRYWPQIARRMRDVDVVNVHGPVPTVSDAFLRLSGWLPAHARPAIVYTHHSLIDIRGAGRLSSWYNRRHESLARRADRIVTSSVHYARQHRSRYGPLVRVIPWGVDASKPPPRRARGPADPLRVLFVGQMRPYKGVETLLAAVAGQPDIRLTLVGQGSQLPGYQNLAARLAADNARFVGRLSAADLGGQYEASDVIVLPSVTRAEAFGLVLLEGMAAGCVPVASDLPGVREVAGPTGLLVPPADPHALRAALRGLASDPGRIEVLQEESWLAAQSFSWERCVRSYEQVLFDAVRCRYARLHGLAILPEVAEPGRDRWSYGVRTPVLELPVDGRVEHG